MTPALRPFRDYLGEALRRERHGLMRPLWNDLEDRYREPWCRKADFIIARLDEADVSLVKCSRLNTPEKVGEGV